MRQVFFASIAAAGVVVVLQAQPAPTDVRLIPVEGEAARYWPRWRGPSGQGHVTGTNYTDTWSSTQHVKWRTTVPGLGHSSPIVWKDHLFLTTATNDGAKVSLLAFRRSDGRQLWQTVVPTSGVEHVYAKNRHASATPATDGQRIYASFGDARAGGVRLLRQDRVAPAAWRTRRTTTAARAHRSSTRTACSSTRTTRPDRLVRRRVRHEDGQRHLVERRGRDARRAGARRSSSTPAIMTSSSSAASSACWPTIPTPGAELWTVRGNTREVIPTPVVGHGLVFCSSGRAGPTLAIKPGGKGDVTATHVAWSTPRGSPFVPSALVHGDLLYMINDMQSILTVRATPGPARRSIRTGSAKPTREGFSSSPVAVGEKLFFTNDRGQTFVVQAGSTFKLLHVNELNAQVLASPALVDGTWYWRTDKELIAIQ